MQMINAKARDRKKLTPTKGTSTIAMFLMWMNQSVKLVVCLYTCKVLLAKS